MMRWTPYVVAAAVVALPAPALASQWLAYFDYGQAQLQPEGYQLAASIAAYIARGDQKPAQILIVAHLDAAEADEFNDELALQRAQAMANELVRLGVDPTVIQMQSKGATQRARSTADHVREQANRRLIVDVNY